MVYLLQCISSQEVWFLRITTWCLIMLKWCKAGISHLQMDTCRLHRDTCHLHRDTCRITLTKIYITQCNICKLANNSSILLISSMVVLKTPTSAFRIHILHQGSTILHLSFTPRINHNSLIQGLRSTTKEETKASSTKDNQLMARISKVSLSVSSRW